MKRYFWIFIFLCALTRSSACFGQAIAGGLGHNAFIKSNGTVCGWGQNTLGQIGDGTTVDRPTPVAVAITASVTAIAAGQTTTLFLKSDGTIWGTGYNEVGQLGLGNRTQQNTPVHIMTGSFFTAIASGTNLDHSLFLRNDGTVWACGRNDDGELGINSTSPSFFSPCTASGGPNACEWTPVQVHGVGDVGFLTNIVKVFAGAYHSFAISNTGTVYAWGENASGALGDGSTTGRLVPVVVTVPGGSTVAKISTSTSHTLFLKADGTVWACGNGNSYFETNSAKCGGCNFCTKKSGLLADGTQNNTSTPVQCTALPAGTWIDIASGGDVSLFLRNDGTLWGSGLNVYGALGNSDPFPTCPVQTPVQLSVGSVFTAVGVGAHGQGASFCLRSDGALISAGYNVNGEVGDGTLTCAICPGSVGACAPRPYATTNTCSGKSTPSQVIGCVTSIMPVELISFTASCNSGEVKCQWQTASETNNDYFTIDRSGDAAHWETAGTVTGAGNSSTILNYEFADIPPSLGEREPGGEVYYRLKQTDFDGKYKYYNPVAAVCSAPDKWNLVLQNIFYEDELKGTLLLPGDAEFSVCISDMQGRIVKQEQFSGVKGSNFLKIKLANVERGFYFIKIHNSAKSLQGKFMKL